MQAKLNKCGIVNGIISYVVPDQVESLFNLAQRKRVTGTRYFNRDAVYYTAITGKKRLHLLVFKSHIEWFFTGV